MADQTHGAVDSLLVLLSNAIKDEAKLLSGVQGDIQFIKDEMDSMNGFLLHMTKTEMDHNDQHRAWMKQVRDIADIAQDCILLYMDLSPPDRGLWDLVRHVPMLLWTMPARHRLATKIRELKVRVREVGERRLRYGVTVPEKLEDKQLKRSKPAGQDDKDIDQKRKDFLHALGLEDVQETTPPAPHEPFNNAIELLLKHTASQYYADTTTTIRSVVKKCMPDVHTSKMFLCALHAYPYGSHRTKEELEKLERKLKDGAADVHNEVMIFCYSELSTHYKICLQYLTAFHEETSISRTSLVRRWVAEGIVATEEGKTLEEAAERCFNELVFRGFVRPFETGDAGKVKSCCTRTSVTDPSVRALWDFIDDISKSENFVAGLPIHFERQVEIRKIVQRILEQKPQGAGGRSKAPSPWNICGLSFQTKPQDESAGDSSTTADSKDPKDEMVELLKSLPEEYRLNVLDLGGCRGLKKRHLKSICKVRSIKYLSLRNTDVSRLPKQINNLRKLETLDIRGTNVRATDTKHIFLPKLKHLLAGHIDCEGDGNESLSTVRIPRRMGKNTEILCHVQVLHGEVELEQVGHLKQLRKLGVVLHGSEDNIKHLLRVINKLSECLRSLSVWMKQPTPLVTEGVSLDNKAGDTLYSPPKNLESLNINGNLGNNGLPTWIQNLTNLSKVTLCETSLPDESLQRLGNLPGLLCLRLRRKSFTDSRLTFNSGEFKKLKFLLTEASTSASVITFQDRAAPMLQKIVWRSLTGVDNIISTDTISGIKHLLGLEEVELKGCHFNSRPYPLEQDIAAHPKRPALIYPLKPAPGTIIIEGPDV